MTRNSVELAQSGLKEIAQRDGKVGPFFKERWSAEKDPVPYAFLTNVSAWEWGHSDFDWCCDDNAAPAYALYMVTQQGHPTGWDVKKGSWFEAMVRYNGTILQWLRSYFPKVEPEIIV